MQNKEIEFILLVILLFSAISTAAIYIIHFAGNPLSSNSDIHQPQIFRTRTVSGDTIAIVNDVDAGMKLRVYTLLPFQSSDLCNDVNNIILQDIWVISARVHFTKKNNSFPGKFIEGFNGSHMKAVVRDGHWGFY